MGPSHFAVERGTPNSRQVVITTFRESAHCEESGAPTTTKSEHTQVDTHAELRMVRALFDHRRSHPCEWSDDAIY